MTVRQITFVSLFIIIFAPLGLFFYWRYTHRYIPPPPRAEINITIIPGWNLRQIAADWLAKGLIKSEKDFFYYFGAPPTDSALGVAPAASWDFMATGTLRELLADKPTGVPFEGYFLPETYRVYADGSLEEAAYKIFSELDKRITPEMRIEIKKQNKTFYEILTMAAVVQKEAGDTDDVGKIADVFWRRYDSNWALQSCATVNYLTGKNTPAISADDKQIDSPYNTYKYPGLPPGPISNPSIETIGATIKPTKNDFWYFMAGSDGVTHFAKTLDEHNINVAKYLR